MRNKKPKGAETTESAKNKEELLEAGQGEELGGKREDLEAELEMGGKKDDDLEDLGEKYSDIDAMFEKKLKNNDYKADQDVFDELFTNQPKSKYNI